MQSIECSDWSSEIKCNLQSQACRGSGGWGEGVPCLWPPQSQKPTWARPLKGMLSSVAQSCPTLCDPVDCIMDLHGQASLSITNSRSLLKLMAIESVMPSNHLILCHPLLLPSIFPSIRVFSNESVLHIRWPKYWSFGFSISPSNEHPGLISFRMDWLDLFTVPGILKSSPTPQFKSIILQHSAL